MSNYEPQVGDRVRRTYPDGTIMEGVIARLRDGCAGSASGFTLHNDGYPEQTELLERPVKLNTEPGAMYGDTSDLFQRVVRVGTNGSWPWLGSTGNGNLWHTDKEVEALVRDKGWVEFNLDGSRKSE